MAKFRLEFSALSIAKLKQNKTPFRSTKAAFWKNETAFGECPKRRFGSKGILLYLILRKIGFALSNDYVAEQADRMIIV